MEVKKAISLTVARVRFGYIEVKDNPPSINLEILLFGDSGSRWKRLTRGDVLTISIPAVEDDAGYQTTFAKGPVEASIESENVDSGEPT